MQMSPTTLGTVTSLAGFAKPTLTNLMPKDRVTLGLGMIAIPIGVGVGAANATGGSWGLASVGGAAGYLVDGWAGGTLAEIIEGAQGK